MPKEISRRDFLKTSAVSTVGVAALGLMGGCSSAAISGDSASLTESATTPATEDNVPAWLGEVPSITDTNISEVWNTEILIVGAGNGGLTAAAKASDLGMDFRLIEQNSLVQDTRGWYGAINTQECLDSGYKVDIPLLRSEISRYASGKLDQRVLNVWINESRAMHEYIKPLMEEAGYKLVFSADTGVEDSTGTPYYCSPQEHFYADNKGAVSKARNPLLQARIERNGYGINFNTSLVKLITSGNKVTGAIAQNTDTGAYIKINASHAVILATGGYPGNPEMVASLNPMIPACVTACSFSPSNRGQGIKAGLWAGASMDLEPAAMIFDRGLVAPGVDAGYVVDANGNKTFPGTVKQFNPGTQPFLKVNRDGERFANENSPYNDISHAASLQKGGVYCQIFDSGILEDVKVSTPWAAPP